MKRVTIRVTVSDQQAQQLATGYGMVDSTFHGQFDVVDVEELGNPFGVRIVDADGEETVTWHDEGHEAFALAKDALKAGRTVQMLTRETVPA